MKRFTNTFLKIAIGALCAVSVFSFSGMPHSSEHIAAVFAVPRAEAQSQGPNTDTVSKPPESTPISWSDTTFWTSGAFLIYITGMLLSFAGWALNGAIYYFVIKMGTFLGGQSALGKSIISSWAIIRDIINLTFVFGMIYLAFMTIVKADTHKLKHGVVQIVIAALLINFSLFFAKAIIDFGNVAAVEVYSYMEALGHPAGVDPNDWTSYGISGYFMDQLGLTSFFHPGEVISEGMDPSLATGPNTGFGFSLLVSLTLLIATFVFFAGAILIAIRFVTLALLLILSPVAFAGAALPGISTEEWSHQWWKSLVSNVLFAPAYFLLLFISMKAVNLNALAQGLNSASPGNIVGFFKGEGDAGSILAFMNFVLVIGFLVGSLIISKRMGAWGADTATKWGARASFGVTAAIGRQTLGRLGNRLAESDTVKDRASQKGVTGFVNRRILSASRQAQKGSFDVRGTSTVQGLAKNHSVNLKLGDAQKGGYAATVEEVANKEKLYGASLGSVDDKDPRVQMFKKMQEEAEHHLHDEEEELKRVRKDYNTWKSSPAGVAATPAEIEVEKAKVTAQEGIVKKMKKDVEGAKEAIEQEKNRRIVGSVVTAEAIAANPAAAGAKAAVDTKKNDLKGAIETAATAADEATRKAALANIAKYQKEVKELEGAYEGEVAKMRGNNVGYAGVVDSYSDTSTKMGMVTTAAFALVGRNRAMNRAAAKAVRDTKKAAKKAEKKDDHGGGHDDHGGGGHGGGGHH